MPSDSNRRKILYTVGYEGRSLYEFISCLKSSKIDLVLDVREAPVSRKKGFSKSALKAELESNGIGYIHMRELGNPYEMRQKLYENRDYEISYRSFNAYLDNKRSHLEQACSIILSATCCLMCYERLPERCHRSIVAHKIAECSKEEITIVNL